MTDRVKLSTLPNGFRIVTEHMPHVKSAALGIWVNAGSRHETEAEGGLSHMLEHMAFKGTQDLSARQIAEKIEDVGGDLNAYTNYETTAYQARVLAEHVPLALDMLATILRDSVYDPAEIEKERHVILQEIGEYADMPAAMAFEALQDNAFPNQPLGRPIIGTVDSVNSFDRDIIRAYLDRHYAPERMILAVAGYCDHDAVLKQAERLFGDMPRGNPPEMQPAHYAGQRSVIHRPCEQAHVLLGFEAPDSCDLEAQFRAQTAASVLGGGMSSRLFQEAREERGLCYSIYSYAEAFADSGLMSIYAATSPAEASALMTLALDVAERAVTEITEEEASRARAQSKAGLLMGLESPMRRAESLSRQVFLRDRPVPLSEIEAMIDAVDAAAVRAALSQLLNGSRASAIYLGPETGDLPAALKDAA